MLSLWLPILLSSIVLFFASFLSWMVFQLHAKDWVKMNDEESFMNATRSMKIPEGNYMFPGVETPKEQNSPEFQKKYSDGPRGILQILPVVNMGQNLGLTFAFFLFCNATFAYLGSFALQPGAEFINIFRFVATIALLTFSASIVQHSIWFKVRITGHLIESIAYSLIAGGIFAALWPSA